MEKRITSSSIKNDHLSRKILSALEEIEKEINIVDGIAYYDFPLFQDEIEGNVRTQILLISKNYGVVAIDCLKGDASGVEDIDRSIYKLDQLDSVIFSKILKSRLLRIDKRKSKVALKTIVMCEGFQKAVPNSQDYDCLVTSKESLRNKILENISDELTSQEWDELRSIIEGGKGIFKVSERNVEKFSPDKKIHALNSLELEIANFDRDQRLAAITYTQGPQRIRGLAGSGKTIVLAMKVARLHLENPEMKILFTFWTKSLYEVIKNVISRFYRQFSDSDVNWEKIDILHGWGGRNLQGVYYNTCIENGFAPYSLRDVPAHISHGFSYICDLVLQKSISQKYDYVIIDEGQDFPPSFFKLCFLLAKGGDKDRNIVWAYDELQTIMEADTQDLTTTFGLNDKGEPRVNIERAQKEFSDDLLPHDVILKKCYRNPREVLVAAHSLGFGIYDQMVQNLQDQNHWEDVGYELIGGQCEVGNHVVFSRPEKNSPLSISKHASAGKLIEYQCFDNFSDELNYVFNEVLSFLQEGIDLHDMLIVCLDDRNLNVYTSRLSERFAEKDILINNIKASTYSSPRFFIENQITISS